MLPKRNSEAPPPVMTWSKAGFILAIALIFDAFSFIFAVFGMFGSALASALGGVTAGIAVFVGGGIQVFGLIMAMCIGFFGWMVVGGMMLMSNARIFKGGNTLWFGGALIIDQLPFINILPALTPIVSKMYRAQIKADKKAFAEYEKRQAAFLLAKQQEQKLQIRMQQMAITNHEDEQQGTREFALQEQLSSTIKDLESRYYGFTLAEKKREAVRPYLGKLSDLHIKSISGLSVDDVEHLRKYKGTQLDGYRPRESANDEIPEEERQAA
jgi:hypothetical protein